LRSFSSFFCWLREKSENALQAPRVLAHFFDNGSCSDMLDRMPQHSQHTARNGRLCSTRGLPSRQKVAESCCDARQNCSLLFAAAHDGNVERIRAATLAELCAASFPCCFDCAKIEHLACMGGAYEVFCELVKKGLKMEAKERVSVRAVAGDQTLYEIAQDSRCQPLIALLKRGVLRVPPRWSIARLLFIGRVDPECVFCGIPKDVARLLARALTEEIRFLEDEM
jgi:hypothetical protein